MNQPGDPPCASGKEFMRQQQQQEQQTSSDCPIPEEVRSQSSKFGVYNVYNQRVDGNATASSSSSSKGENSAGGGFRFLGRLDPRNNMPSEANQKRAPGQKNSAQHGERGVEDTKIRRGDDLAISVRADVL
jgi:hypothetical protein